MKYCNGCKQTKDESEFNKNRRSKDGLRHCCRECQNSQDRKLREANRKRNDSEASQVLTKHCNKCNATKDEGEFNKNRNSKDGLHYCCRECKKSYEQQNPEIQRKSRRKNRESRNAYNAEYCSKRRSEDIQFLIAGLLRRRMSLAIRRGTKSGSAVQDLGCSVEELIVHIESQFYDDRMSWETRGTEWHIDHIYPLAQADLEDRVQFLAVNNWRNLQPLTIADNLDKRDNVLPEAQLLFDELCDMFQKKEEAA